MHALRLLTLLMGAFVWSQTTSAQPPFRPGNRPPLGLAGPRGALVITQIPSAVAGDRGIAVGVLPPLEPRFPQGAPVVINVPGGVSTGGVAGRPEYAAFGFVEIRFAFPGGGQGDATSGGKYDFRGPDCIRALADVIRFATGRLADRQGRRLHQLLSNVKPLYDNVGIVGSSHGGNACGLAMATHGEEFPNLAFYASMESPYGEGNVNIELGSREQGVNPAYNAQTGVLDLSKLAWSPDLPPGPPRRWQGPVEKARGALYFDLNGDGRYSAGEDFPTNAFVQDLGHGPKVWYTPRLIREAEQRKLFGDRRPEHVPTLAEVSEYWRWRDAAGSIAAAVRKCANLAVIVYANQRDHVQVAPDHPHILTQLEGFRQAGAKFVRLNADRSYVERILGDAAGVQRPFPDNDAGTVWDRHNIRGGLEPEEFPMTPYMQAAVCELADRVAAGNWSKNLDAVLYADAPWGRAAGPRDNAPARPPLERGGPRPLGKRPPREEKPAGASPTQTLRERFSPAAGSTDATKAA